MQAFMLQLQADPKLKPGIKSFAIPSLQALAAMLRAHTTATRLFSSPPITAAKRDLTQTAATTAVTTVGNKGSCMYSACLQPLQPLEGLS
jgi:hypothetical protein